MTSDILTWGVPMFDYVSGMIVLILLIRRPVAKYFGTEATFLLWSIPALRLLMPNIRLPVKNDILIYNYDPLTLELIQTDLSDLFNTQDGPSLIESTPPTTPLETTGQFDIVSLVVFVWIIGGVLWLSYHLIRHYKFTRLLRNVSSPPNASLIPTIGRALDLIGLKRPPEILIAPKNIGPLVNGISNPLVILPKDFAVDYSTDAQLFALCHEFAHIKRRDLIWAFGLLIFRALNWYNPLVHYAAKRFNLDQEAACDAHTLSKFGHNADTHKYALTLLMSEQSPDNTTSKTPAMPALNLGLNNMMRENVMKRINLEISNPLTLGMGHPTTERIKRLTVRKTNKVMRYSTAIFILAVVSATTPISSTLAQEPILAVAKIQEDKPETGINFDLLKGLPTVIVDIGGRPYEFLVLPAKDTTVLINSKIAEELDLKDKGHVEAKLDVDGELFDMNTRKIDLKINEGDYEKRRVFWIDNNNWEAFDGIINVGHDGDDLVVTGTRKGNSPPAFVLSLDALGSCLKAEFVKRKAHIHCEILP